MKPNKAPNKTSVQSKSGVKQPVRTSNNSSIRNTRDVSPESKPTAFLKMKAKEIQNTSNSGLFSNTPTKRSPSQHNRSSINEKARSTIDDSRLRQSINIKSPFSIRHIFTYEIPKIDDSEQNEYNSALLKLLLDQKEQEIAELKAMIVDQGKMIEYLGSCDQQVRPTDIDNALFTYEEEKVKLEAKFIELQHQLEAKDRQITQNQDFQNFLNQQLVNLELQVEERDDLIVKLKQEVNYTQNNIEQATRLANSLVDVTKEYFESAGIPLNIQIQEDSLESILEQLFDKFIEMKRTTRDRKAISSSSNHLITDNNQELNLESNNIHNVNLDYHLKISYVSNQNQDEFVIMDDFNQMVIELADLRLKVHKITDYLSKNTEFCLEDLDLHEKQSENNS